METTNDDNLLKTLACLERKTINQIPEEYKQRTKNLSSRFGVMFYDDKIIVPKNLRNTVITLLQKGHPCINKMSHAAKPLWWPRMSKDIQQKSVGTQLPMSEINYLPSCDKTNQEVQSDLIGPMRFKQRRNFYIIIYRLIRQMVSSVHL